jgi:Ca-activated chloride channel family protein
MDQLPLEGPNGNGDGLGYEVVAIEKGETVEVMLRLQAPGEPVFHPDPFHIQIVLDTSDSMHPRKLFPALRGIDYMLNELQMEDRVGLVTFGGGAKLACPGTEAWEGDDVREAMRQIQPFGLSEPGPGLMMGVREADRNSVCGQGAIFLISDSHMGRGDHELAQELAGIAAGARKAGLTVSTLSMDGRPNPVLKAVAKAGGGKFIATDDGQRVTRTMLEKLPSVTGGRIYGVEMALGALGCGTKVVIPDYPSREYEESVVAQIGDLKSGERREVLFRLEVPGLAQMEDRQATRIELKWFDTGTRKALGAAMPLKVNGYRDDSHPGAAEPLDTAPEEGVQFEFEPVEIPEEELEIRRPGRRDRKSVV